MIVSFHPRLAGSVDLRLPRGPSFSAEVAEVLSRARAVVVPQSVRPEHYAACLRACPSVFPDYRWRFGHAGKSCAGKSFEGKSGAAALFAACGAAHPKTLTFATATELRERCRSGLPKNLSMNLPENLPENLPMALPFVLKGDRGGGGSWVWLIRQAADLDAPLAALERLGWPVVVQEFVPHGGRDARVVVVGERLFSYWRRQNNPAEFRCNVVRGGVLDHDGEPGLLAKAEGAVRGLCRRVGLNLAAFDLVFRSEEPLFLEVNYCFGRRGLAVAGDYYALVAAEVNGWLSRLGLEGCRIRPR